MIGTLTAIQDITKSGGNFTIETEKEIHKWIVAVKEKLKCIDVKICLLGKEVKGQPITLISITTRRKRQLKHRHTPWGL